jgi:hypothetical protein
LACHTRSRGPDVVPVQTFIPNIGFVLALIPPALFALVEPDR